MCQYCVLVMQQLYTWTCMYFSAFAKENNNKKKNCNYNYVSGATMSPFKWQLTYVVMSVRWSLYYCYSHITIFICPMSVHTLTHALAVLIFLFFAKRRIAHRQSGYELQLSMRQPNILLFFLAMHWNFVRIEVLAMRILRSLSLCLYPRLSKQVNPDDQRRSHLCRIQAFCELTLTRRTHTNRRGRTTFAYSVPAFGYVLHCTTTEPGAPAADIASLLLSWVVLTYNHDKRSKETTLLHFHHKRIMRDFFTLLLLLLLLTRSNVPSIALHRFKWAAIYNLIVLTDKRPN